MSTLIPRHPQPQRIVCCHLLFSKSHSFNCQMCRSSRSDLKVNFLQEEKEAFWARGSKAAYFFFLSFFASSDTFEDLYPTTYFINVKTCKISVLRHSWVTILSCQLFGIIPWQIQCISTLLCAKIRLLFLILSLIHLSFFNVSELNLSEIWTTAVRVQ